MILGVFSSFIAALLLWFSGKSLKHKLCWLIMLLPASLFIYFASFLVKMEGAKVITYVYKWVPSMGVNLSFRMDGLALLFLLLITGIGTLVYLYTSNYLKNHPLLIRFYTYLSLFMGSMIGLVLSDNIITLFIFWELTSISSFFLIGFNNNDAASRKSALTALAVTGFGGLALLGFGVYAYFLTGTTSINEMIGYSEMFENGISGMILLGFIAIAAFTKSAQFPLHFWLPGAMKAPTPVSTYLHSATMVKAGIYLLLRFTPHFELNPYWSPILTTVGAITMLYAAFHTLFRKDLKGILAYSTISALGILVFLIGIGTTASLTAAFVFIIVHALYKAALFLITGIIDHQTKTRDLSQLSGLRKIMWPTAIAGFIVAISSAGIPPTLGFVGKDLIYEATDYTILFTTVAVLTNCLLVYAGFATGIKPFVGKLPEKLSAVKPPSRTLWIPAFLLAVLSVVFGLFPSLLGNIVQTSLYAVGDVSFVKLKLWHGFNGILLLSMVTIIGGFALYYFWKISIQKESWISKFEKISPQTLFVKTAVGFEVIAYKWTRIAQNGHLRNYVLIIVLALIAALGYHIIEDNASYLSNFTLTPMSWNEIAVVGIMFFAIVFSVFARSRLSAIVGLGVVGYTMCFIFVFFSAPDLAMTQFTIDTLTVILFVLVLYRLPPYLKFSNTPIRIRDGLVALVLGGFITLIALEVMDESPVRSAADFYAENSYLLAKGKNVVNVILVDFRGLDTFIEIIVLSIAAIGVFGLLKLRLKKEDK